MKNKILGSLALVVSLFGLTLSVKAVDYPAVVNDTKPDSLTCAGGDCVKVEGTGTQNVTVTVEKGTWNLLDSKQSNEQVSGRTQGYTWVGLKFNMPDGIQSSSVKFAGSDDTYSEDIFTEYFGFNLDKVKNALLEGEDYVTQFVLTWKDSEGKDQSQTITLKVLAANITLIDKDDAEKEVWDSAIYEEVKDEGIALRTHKVEVAYMEYGKVEPDATEALEGTKVTLKVTADAGYELESLVVKKADGTEITVTDLAFEMPNEDVTISATFKAQAVVAPDVTTNEAPATFDNVLGYVVLSITALTATAIVSKKVLSK